MNGRGSTGRAARRWAVRARSTDSSTSAASARTMTAGQRPAIPAGATRRYCRTSRKPRARGRRRPDVSWTPTGRSGVHRSAAKHELIEALIAAGNELGLPRNDDFDGREQEGVGYYHLSTRKGWRCSTAVAYLRPAHGRANLRVETDAQASKVVFDGRRATGVVYRTDGADLTATARREVSLCAGAVQIATAASALRSRAPVRSSTPWASRSSIALPRRRREPAGPFAGADDLRVHEADHHQRRSQDRWWRTLRDGARLPCNPRRSDGRGHQSGRDVRAHRSRCSATPDVQFHVATLSSDMAGSPVHTVSRGSRCRCASSGPNRAASCASSRATRSHAPAMQPNYLSTPRDRQTLVGGIRLARALAATRALAPYVNANTAPVPRRRATRSCWNSRGTRARTIFHAAGTCKMGDIAARSAGRRRCDAARARARRAARRRLQRHADARVGEHQRAGHHDRRKGRRHDPCGCREIRLRFLASLPHRRRNRRHALLPRRFRR